MPKTVAPIEPNVTPDMRDPATPPSVWVRTEARPPFLDPRMGVDVQVDKKKKPTHRLVTLGDSLTHGFQSGCILNTDLSFPKIIAWEMGWDTQFRIPRYQGFGGVGPVPNLEYLLRHIEDRFEPDVNTLDWWDYTRFSFFILNHMDQVEDYWERGRGSHVPEETEIKHNLGVYSWDIRDILDRTADTFLKSRGKPRDHFLNQLVEEHNGLASAYVLHSARKSDPARTALTPVQAAAALGEHGSLEDGTGDGIETLLILIGANNALGAVTRLKVQWSQRAGPRLDASEQERRQYLKEKEDWTVWDPDHFKEELDRLVEAVGKIRARHVIWGTVPHVTIAPIAKGIGLKMMHSAQGNAGSSRYFPFYARPWVTDSTFNPNDDACITHAQARAIDSAIDQYNEAITQAVRTARGSGKDWYLLDAANMLDRLAQRRYIEDPNARPSWWTPYELPPSLEHLAVKPDSRFFDSGPEGRIQGGLFSLDGIHPTTIGYGLLAQEFIRVMQLAGVKFYWGDGKTERTGPVQVDFERLLRLDTLMAHPPRLLHSSMTFLRWLDERTDFLQRLFKKQL